RSRGIAWTNIEVRHPNDGRPQVMVCGAAREIARERGIGDILISVSHCRTYATAYALALSRTMSAPKGACAAQPTCQRNEAWRQAAVRQGAFKKAGSFSRCVQTFDTTARWTLSIKLPPPCIRAGRACQSEGRRRHTGAAATRRLRP